jgi:hypothetical protein
MPEYSDRVWNDAVVHLEREVCSLPFQPKQGHRQNVATIYLRVLSHLPLVTNPAPVMVLEPRLD